MVASHPIDDGSPDRERPGVRFAVIRSLRAVACWCAGIMTLGLLFLCVRGQHTHDSVKVLLNTTGYGGYGDRVFFGSTLSQIYCGHHYGHRGDKFLMLSSRESPASFEQLGIPMNRFWFSVHYSRVLDVTYYAAPAWLLASFSGALCALLLPGWRFPLRSLLIAIAVVAVVLSLARLEIRYPFIKLGDFISRPS